MMIAIARWDSWGGVSYVVLYESNGRYSYAGRDCGGGIGGGFSAGTSREAVIAIMQTRIDSGYFLPDSAKVPMKRVKGIESPVRVVSGPTYHADFDVQEVVVHLGALSGAQVSAAWRKLPEFADFGGRIYRKHDYCAADCMAWYWSKGK